LYKIESVAWDETPLDTFRLKKTNEDITFVEYFRKQYECHIRDHKQPLINARKVETAPRLGEPTRENEVVKLVPELCQLTGGYLIQPYKEDFRFKQAYSQVTNLLPTERFQRLRDFVKRVNQTKPEEIIHGWSIPLPEKPLEVTSNLLASVPIQFNANDLKELDWTRQLQRGGFLKVNNLEDRWLFIYPDNERNSADNFTSKLREVSGSMKFDVREPIRAEYTNQRDTNLYAVLAGLSKDQTQGYLMIVVMISKRDERLYQAIKKKTCELALPSQVITKNILQDKKMMSCVTKVAVQMICKLGGELWGVRAVSSFYFIISDNIFDRNITFFLGGIRINGGRYGFIQRD